MKAIGKKLNIYAMKKFSDLLKDRRKELNITKAQAAKIIGITPMYYGRFEKDQLYPTEKNIGRFSILLNIDRNDLIKLVNYID